MKTNKYGYVASRFLTKVLLFRSFSWIVAHPSELGTSSASFRITLLAGNISSACAPFCEQLLLLYTWVLSTSE